MIKRKILFLITKSNWGGAQRYVYNLATTLSKNEFEVKVVSGNSGLLTDKLGMDHIPVIYINGLKRDVSLIEELLSFFTMLKMLRKEKPNVVHLNSSKAGGLGALAARLVGVEKIIFTAHGWAFEEDRNRLARFVIKFFSWLTVLLSHFTITLNERDLQSFKYWPYWPFVKRKIVKIPNGMKEQIPSPIDARKIRENLERDFGIPGTGILIGTVAELHKNKGLRYLIDAMEDVPETVSLCLVGSGEEKENLEAQVKKLGLEKKVFFTGFLKEASRFMKAFDIFVLPSIKEGSPFVILEAGTNEVPIIATSVGGIPDIITHQKTGLLLKPKDSRALANEINFYLTHEKERDAHAAALKKRIREYFDFEKNTFEKTLTLYRS